MAFPVDERVIMHYCTWYPLVNGESHCIASFWRFMVLVVHSFKSSKMSWAKESADAGVAGLSEWEVLRGVI